MKLQKFREYINKKVELNLVNRVQKYIDDMFDDLGRGQKKLNQAARSAELDLNDAKTKIRQAESLIDTNRRTRKEYWSKRAKTERMPERSIKSAIKFHKQLVRQADEKVEYKK